MNNIKAQSTMYTHTAAAAAPKPISDRTLCPFVAFTFDTLNIGKVCFFLVCCLLFYVEKKQKKVLPCFRRILQQRKDRKFFPLYRETKTK